MDRQTYLAKKIEALLNVYPTFKFQVKDHVADLDIFYGDVIKGYQTEALNFWGLLTDYVGEYIPIKASKSTIESCALYLHIPVIFLDEAMAFFKGAFAESVIALEFTDDLNYRNIMTMNVPSLFGDPQTKDGIDYQIVTISFSFKSSGKYYFGNAVKYYIDNVEVTPFEGRQVDQIKSGKIVQYIADLTGAGYTNENVLKFPPQFYYENNVPLNKILGEILDGLQNIKYVLKIVTPIGTKTYDVILEGGTFAHPLGGFDYLACVFVPASEVLA